MATDEQCQAVMRCKISDNFGVTRDAMFNSFKDVYTSRFWVYLQDNREKVERIWDIVEANGISAPFFTAYELNEGYNGTWGWLNYTYYKGDPYTDAEFVSSTFGNRDYSGMSPAWDDPGGGTVGMVPQSVRAEGNAEYAGWDNKTIGKLYCAQTAAAAWAMWYPQGLNASYNGVQNYANPLREIANTLLDRWGGSVDGHTGTNTGSQGNTGNTGGSKEVTVSGTVSMEEVRQKVKQAILEIFKDNTSKLSPSYYSNTVLTIFNYGNFSKAQINDEAVKKIADIIQDVKYSQTVKVGTDNNESTKPSTPSTGGGDAPTSEKVANAIEQMKALQGTRIGDGQCYTLSGYFAGLCTGYTCSYSASAVGGFGIMSAVGDTLNAWAIHSGWAWSQYGWTVVNQPTDVNDFVPGAIWAQAPYLNGTAGYWTGQYGHTGIVISRDGDSLVVCEQNNSVFGGGACAIHTVSASQFINTITGLVKPTGI